MAVYITFGQDHVHRINGTTIDRDCVAKVESRKRAFELFGQKFCWEYNQEKIDEILNWFPRGIIDLTDGG